MPEQREFEFEFIKKPELEKEKLVEGEIPVKDQKKAEEEIEENADDRRSAYEGKQKR